MPEPRPGASALPLRALWTVALVGLTWFATTRPPFSEDAPQPLSLVRLEHHGLDGSATARLAWGGWGVEAPLPEEVREQASWRPLDRSAFDDALARQWLGGGSWSVRDELITSTPPPRVHVSRRAPDLLEVVVQSRRAADLLALDVEGAEIVETDGHALEVPTSQLMVFGSPRHASTFVVKTTHPVTVTAADVRFGAHPIDRHRTSNRPSWAAPRQWGDRHVVTVTTRLENPTDPDAETAAP